MNAPCSGEICMIAIGSSDVSAISACCTASGGVPCAMTYWWISGVRKNDLGSAMVATLWLRRDVDAVVGAEASGHALEPRPAARAHGVAPLEPLGASAPGDLGEARREPPVQRQIAQLPRHHEPPEGEIVTGTTGAHVHPDAHRPVHHVDESLLDRVGEHRLVDGHDARGVRRRVRESVHGTTG